MLRLVEGFTNGLSISLTFFPAVFWASFYAVKVFNFEQELKRIL